MNGTFLPAKTIAARVNSATGMAFASAALASTMPRRHTSPVTSGRTLPALWKTARSAGACRSRSAVSAGAPQEVTSTSTSRSRARAAGESSSGSQIGSPSRTRPASRSRRESSKCARYDAGSITTNAGGLGTMSPGSGGNSCRNMDIRGRTREEATGQARSLPIRLEHLREHMTLFGLQRQERLMQELRRLGAVHVRGLAEMLGVSELTVRRDLAALAARNLLTRVHGGATLPTNLAPPAA